MSEVRKADNHFEIIADDGNVAGRMDFLDHNGERIIYHTEISEQYGGQGLAGAIARGGLEATKDEGLSVVAVCPFVRGWLEKHPADVEAMGVQWRKPRPADLQWLDDELKEQ
ncbi:GNAT family N-acetyltransferase [Corynebacterium sp. S7]